MLFQNAIIEINHCIVPAAHHPNQQEQHTSQDKVCKTRKADRQRQESLAPVSDIAQYCL
jgi:hypothetical protein